jgi:hypothetical protein
MIEEPGEFWALLLGRGCLLLEDAVAACRLERVELQVHFLGIAICNMGFATAFAT